jgi:hypothetical protein
LWKKKALKQSPAETLLEKEALKQSPAEMLLEKEALKQSPTEMLLEKEALKQSWKKCKGDANGGDDGQKTKSLVASSHDVSPLL